MQPLLSQAELEQRQQARAFSRKLFARGLRGAEQWELLQEKFGFDRPTCEEIYHQMLEGIHREIVEAKTNPVGFRAKRHRRTRNNENAPWSVRISAQIELDELFELVDVAQEPEGWDNVNLMDAWSFYTEAIGSEKITENQRHCCEKRLDLLMYGPKRQRNSEAARRRRDRDMRHQPSPPEQDEEDWATLIAKWKQHGYQKVVPPGVIHLGPPAAPSCATGGSPVPTQGTRQDTWKTENVTRSASAPAAEDVAPAPGSAGASPSRPDANRPARPPASDRSAFGIPHSALPPSTRPAPPVPLAAAQPPASPARGARLVESDSDSDDDAPDPQAQPPP